MKRLITFLVTALVFLTAVPAEAKLLKPGDIEIPDGYKVEVAVKGLSAPTMVTFDNEGRMIIAESGYGRSGQAKVTRIEKDGEKTVLVRASAFGAEVPVTAVAHYEGQIYVVHGGSVSLVREGGVLEPLITGLPGQGDHQANQLVFRDGFMYFTIGTVTNSGVVGIDNEVFGWLKKTNLRGLHDVACKDISVKGSVFETENPLTSVSDTVKTSAFSAFGQTRTEGERIVGNVKCNGAVLRARPDGSGLTVIAWGLRNPYGLEIGPDNSLYMTMHGYDARGSRPIESAWDCFYKVTEGVWYGFPDFACDVPVTDEQFQPEGQPIPEFLLASHPGTPPKPIAKFNPHAAANGFAFAPSSLWGKPTDAFVALFGDFTPATGTVEKPQGVQVVRVDAQTGEISEFLQNKQNGQALRRGGGGIEHPSDVTFGPDGAMYIADWGVARVSVNGLKLDTNSGVVWKVTPSSESESVPVASSSINTLLLFLIFAFLTYWFTRGKESRGSLMVGADQGARASLVMGLASFAISAWILNLPWYAPARVFAVMVMGDTALANILEFRNTPFWLGLFMVVILGAVLGLIFNWFKRNNENNILAGLFYGLAVWSLLQYFFLPTVFPLITEKGFPPFWYAVTFAIYGITLGWLPGLKRKG